jgi:multisubunit Na+/H+ antiporter MnhG subunit
MTGGTIAMIPNWTTFSWSDNGASVICLILLTIGSIALIHFNDWYRSMKERKAKSSVGELEALFALEDYPKTHSYRQSAQR